MKKAHWNRISSHRLIMYCISMHWGGSIWFSTSSACWYLCSALVWSKSLLIYLSSRLCQHEPISPHLDRDRWNRSYKLSSSFNRQLRINMRMVKGRAPKLLIILRSFKEPLELTVIKPDVWSRVCTRSWCLVIGWYIVLKISADCSQLQRVLFDTACDPWQKVFA